MLPCVPLRVLLHSLRMLKRYRTSSHRLAMLKWRRSDPTLGRSPSSKGFGILFSFQSDLEWEDLLKSIEACTREYPVAHLPNAIFILSKGVILFSQDLEAGWHNDERGNCLSNFYNISMELLWSTSTSRPNIGEYFRLPLTTGKLSYYFVHGAFAEMRKCPKHGGFLRTISRENLTKIVTFCDQAESIKWIKALDIAKGIRGLLTPNGLPKKGRNEGCCTSSFPSATLPRTSGCLTILFLRLGPTSPSR